MPLEDLVRCVSVATENIQYRLNNFCRILVTIIIDFINLSKFVQYRQYMIPFERPHFNVIQSIYREHRYTNSNYCSCIYAESASRLKEGKKVWVKSRTGTTKYVYKNYILQIMYVIHLFALDYNFLLTNYKLHISLVPVHIYNWSDETK